MYVTVFAIINRFLFQSGFEWSDTCSPSVLTSLSARRRTPLWDLVICEPWLVLRQRLHWSILSPGAPDVFTKLGSFRPNRSPSCCCSRAWCLSGILLFFTQNPSCCLFHSGVGLRTSQANNLLRHGYALTGLAHTISNDIIGPAHKTLQTWFKDLKELFVSVYKHTRRYNSASKMIKMRINY